MKEMKKYAAPAMKVMSINVQNMIAASGDNPVPQVDDPVVTTKENLLDGLFD